MQSSLHSTSQHTELDLHYRLVGRLLRDVLYPTQRFVFGHMAIGFWIFLTFWAVLPF